MRVDVSELKKQVGLSAEYHFRQDSLKDLFSEDAIEVGPIDIKVRLVNTGEGGFVADFEVLAKATAPCSRCMKPAELRLDFSFTEEFLPSVAKVSADDDVEVFTYEDDEIDFSEAVRQNLLVNLPMKVICRSDCPGMCPRCGQDLGSGQCDCVVAGQDSRWEALRNLKGSIEGGEWHGGSEEENVKGSKRQKKG